MTSDPFSYVAIAGALLAGLIWGWLSARLPIPEWLRLLSIFLWTGGLGVLAMLVASVAMHSWTAPRVVEAASLGPRYLVSLVVGQVCLSFLAGAAFGLPATLGWVITYRQPPPGRS